MREPRLPRFILVVSSSDTSLVVSTLDIRGRFVSLEGVKEINRLRKEINRLLRKGINRLRKEINCLFSKGMSNICLKVTMRKTDDLKHLFF